MKKISLLITTLLLSFSPQLFADGAPVITIPDGSYSVEGKLMNLELSENGGVITVKGIAGKYGRVFLTYNMKTNPNFKTRGSFTGRGMGIDDNGNREFAVRAGIWSREGTTLTLHSFDDLTDGVQNMCKSVLDLSSGEFKMTFYSI